MYYTMHSLVKKEAVQTSNGGMIVVKRYNKCIITFSHALYRTHKVRQRNNTIDESEKTGLRSSHAGSSATSSTQLDLTVDADYP